MTIEVLATEATLNTLSVTVQALMVSGKQMTLAVFRQLPQGFGVLDDGTLADFHFWGKVLYKIKDEGDEWAVAEKYGKLYRCRILEKWRVESNSLEYNLQNTIRGYGAYSPRAKELQAKYDLEQETIPQRIESFEKLRALPQLFIAV